MAEQSRADHKAELIARLDSARSQFARSLAHLRRDADVGAHIKHSFTTHKAAWIGSAGIAGWLLSRLPSRKKEVVHKENEAGKIAKDLTVGGLLFGLLKTGFTLFRPVIMGLATRKIAEYVKKNDYWEK